MNLSKSLKITGFFLIFSLIVYYFLGGFNEIDYSVLPGENFEIVGREYIGSNNSDELQQLFVRSKSLAENYGDNGILVIVNDDSMYDAENNQVSYFIGILITTNHSADIPDGFQLRKYDSEAIIRARIKAHNLVMPKPDKVKSKVAGLAQDQNRELSSISVEKYLEENILEIDFLVK